MFWKDKKVKDKNDVLSVAKYYDEWTARYMEVAGDAIQAFRTKDLNILYDYTAHAAEIEDGMHILDAGCGICGPAIYFASTYKIKIDAITVSDEQVRIAIQKINSASLRGQVTPIQGDYHCLTKYYAVDSFDIVLFLESLGHAENPEKVVQECYNVLKPGGCIYIKDFFQRESNDKEHQRHLDGTVENINRLYAYNTLDLHEILSALRKSDFILKYIRKPTFDDDQTVRAEFEARNNINIFGDLLPFIPSDWLELFFKKPLAEEKAAYYTRRK